MGANCTSNGKKLCSNDLTTSANLTFHSQNNNLEKSNHRNNQQKYGSSLNNKSLEAPISIIEEKSIEIDDYLIKNEELIEYEEIVRFPVLSIACMNDLKMNHDVQNNTNQNIKQQNYVKTSSQDGIKNSIMQSDIYQNIQQSRVIIKQPLKVIKKPTFGSIIQHIVVIPTDENIYSYNVQKNNMDYVLQQQYQNMSSSQDIPNTTRSKSSSFLSNSKSKMRKLTIFINQFQIHNTNIFFNLISAKQYHISFKITHEKHKDFFNSFLSKVDCTRLSLQFKNVQIPVNPIQMPNLRKLKLNLEGYQCSSNNQNFQQSLFYFICSNSTSIICLKIKTRECTIDYFFKLLTEEVVYREIPLTKISLDLLFYGQNQQDMNLLIETENFVKRATWIQQWNLAFRLKKIEMSELEEFERNSHDFMLESYLCNQQKESFIWKPIEQSGYLSPIIKPRDYSPQPPSANPRRVSFDQKNIITNSISEHSHQKASNTSQYMAGLLSSNGKRISAIKKVIKPINGQQNQQDRIITNKPSLMLMQELQQKQFIEQVQLDTNQNKQLQYSPYSNNQDQQQHQMNNKNNYQGTQMNKKSVFLDSSISFGVDFFNEKVTEFKIDLFPQLVNQIVRINKLVSQKEMRKFIFVDSRNYLDTTDLLASLQMASQLRTLEISASINEDKQFYAIQNILKQNSFQLKHLTLKLEKKTIISVFDDQRLFNQLEKLSQLQKFIIQYQTNDFLPKYILRIKNLLQYNDLHQHKISINKFNPFPQNINNLINLLKSTNLLSIKTNQLELNIPDNINNILKSHLQNRKKLCHQFCALRNFKIKHQQVYLDISEFYL